MVNIMVSNMANTTENIMAKIITVKTSKEQ